MGARIHLLCGRDIQHCKAAHACLSIGCQTMSHPSTPGMAFQIKLRTGFLALADEFPDRCQVIDATRSPEAIAADIAARVS